MMSGFMQICRMDFKNMLKSPVLIGYNTLFFFLIVLIMGFLNSGAYQHASNAYLYYTVTFLGYGILNGAMTATNIFMERDIKKANLRIIHSPVGSFPIYFSKIVTSCVFNYLCHLLVLAALVLLLHLDFDGTHAGYLLLLMVPIEFAACALGVLFCCVFKAEEGASTLLSNVIAIFAFLGGTFFSWDGMGGTMSLISKLSPVKWLNDTFFAILVDGNLSSFLPVLGVSILTSVLLVFGCVKLFRTEDYVC
ncbi:ABC transporter permease [Bacillus sp. FJAT-27264]|uniref:ABC transporter permease n=1 Tax=Paenibacillus sp. (strain DSM 101736 / FJAT-27264) TaxID=1850362 RepID=UPI001C306FCD|nr:ABC transporter permease [Bacillus sp. FJAT-27264]